ncbi:MAG: bifunctional diguanylate cyclase/phosphodiesterase [Acidimicrobiia bacterium]|nr:bifunctional diguanylate cyclase/phosphodiesterase [Acidimicrobiia bacterium]
MKTLRVMMRDQLLAATIGALVVFAMTFIWFLGHARAGEAADDRLIRTVRQQMTATAELGNTALLYLGSAATADEITTTLTDLTERHRSLSTGSDTLDLPGARSLEEEQRYAAAGGELQQVLDDAQRLLEDPTAATGVALAESTRSYRGALLPIGNGYVIDASTRANRNARIEIVAIAVGSSLALGLAMLVGPYSRRRRDLVNAIAKARESHGRGQVDPLTGLPKRTAFRDRLVQAVHRAARGEQFTGLLVLAVDRASAQPIGANDPDADVIITSVARVLGETLRSTDVVARSGRDQFAILVDIRRTEDISAVAEKLLGALSRPLEPADLTPTISIGAAVAPVDTDTADDLLQIATAAMLGVRRNGGGSYGFYAPEHAEGALGAIQIMERLRGAVRRSEGLWLAYQPKVRMDDRSLAGYEALVRWRDEELGDMLPGDFIPIAEQNDLIIDLGAWVIEHACRQMALWAEAGRPPVPVSVNVSPRQVRHGTLLEITEKALRRHHIDPGLLELEITEAVMLDDESRPLSRLRDLRALGVTIAVDDFGTGYSSLSYLRQFPVNTLKIDRSFVQGLAPGSNDIAIAKTIIALGYSLGLEVVAEGVETEEQFDILRDLGCDLAQGYLFSAPVPPSALEALDRRPARSTRSRSLAFETP